MDSDFNMHDSFGNNLDGDFTSLNDIENAVNGKKKEQVKFVVI